MKAAASEVPATAFEWRLVLAQWQKVESTLPHVVPAGHEVPAVKHETHFVVGVPEQMSDAHCWFELHVDPLQRPQLPPQSTFVSPLPFLPSKHVDGRQMPVPVPLLSGSQTPDAQSEVELHFEPSAHFRPSESQVVPPQSTSVSPLS